MKTKTFAILFALVMVLSMAVGVFAQDFTETWDENTVLTVFNDLDMYFPDMFADEDSDFIWTDNGPADFPSEFPKSADAYTAKAPIEEDTAKMEATYDPCGDGLIKYEFVLDRDPFVVGTDETPWTAVAKYGPERTSYIRNVKAQVGDDTVAPWHEAEVKKCTARGEDNCNIISFLNDEQLIRFGEDLECSTADLYSAYCYWCNLNSVTPLRRESFNAWLKNNHAKYNIEYSHNVLNRSSGKKARGYRGLNTTYWNYL